MTQAMISQRVEALGSLPVTASPIEAYRGIVDLIMKKATLVESESKRLEQLGQMISAERAHRMVYDLIAAVKMTVKDQALVREIGRKLESILGIATRNRTA